MSADIIWKQGDTQPTYIDTLFYSDSTVPPLRGATVSLRLRSLTSASLTDLTGATQVLDPDTATVAFTPSASDTATPGNYFAEWVVAFPLESGLGIQTFPTDGYNWITVEPNVGAVGQKIVDLGDTKKYLNIQDSARDAELLNLIDAVTPLLEQEVGPIVPRIYEEWHDGGSNLIQLSRTPSVAFGSSPVLQLIAASEFRGPIEYPLALVASPAFGSIYSAMLVVDNGTITRRTAGGRTLAFMPGREAVHIWYKSGQAQTPPNVYRAALEAIRVGFRWPQQIGRGSMSPADAAEVGAVFSAELTRVIRLWCRPTRRAPSFA